MNSNKINEYAKTIHANNVVAGWWPENRCLLEAIQLVSTEVSEATEGERKDLMDDKLPHRKMGEVELADALIRMLDFGGYMGLKHRFNSLVVTAGKKASYYHYHINSNLFASYPEDMTNMNYSAVIDCILDTGLYMNYDIEGAMIEKLEFNKTRPDHKIENRMKEGGKKF